jgi:hypothetical protein
MKHPTPDQAIAKLDANPAANAEFERHRKTEAPGMTRRQAVVLALNALKARRSASHAQARANSLAHYATSTRTDLLKASRALLAKPAAAAPSIQAQYDAITDETKRRSFRRANWASLISPQ